jgi:hypothetical protein
MYTAGSPGLIAFTTNNLLSLIVNLDTAVTSGNLAAQTLIMDSARLRRVRVWIAGPSGGSTSAALDWSTTNPFLGNDGTLSTASQVGSAEALHLDKKPPKNSFASMWVDQASTSYTLFTLNCVSNGSLSVIMDLDVDMVLLDKFTTSPIQFNLRATQTWASATGQLLFCHADSQAGAPAWAPVGVSNTY